MEVSDKLALVPHNDVEYSNDLDAPLPDQPSPAPSSSYTSDAVLCAPQPDQPSRAPSSSNTSDVVLEFVTSDDINDVHLQTFGDILTLYFQSSLVNEAHSVSTVAAQTARNTADLHTSTVHPAHSSDSAAINAVNASNFDFPHTAHIFDGSLHAVSGASFDLVPTASTVHMPTAYSFEGAPALHAVEAYDGLQSGCPLVAAPDTATPVTKPRGRQQYHRRMTLARRTQNKEAQQRLRDRRKLLKGPT